MDTNESIDLDDQDIDEPPPTDPCPGSPISAAIRVDPSEDDLERRLAWLAAEVRSTSAEQARKKRQESVLEAREYKVATIPASSNRPIDADLPKVSLAAGVDPTREPTLVGRRPPEHEWDFDISDPEELSRTLPLDPHAPVADPLPFHVPRKKNETPRNSFLPVLVGSCLVSFGALLLQSLVHSSTRAAFDEMPMAKRILAQAAVTAELHYDRSETVRMLLPTVNSAESAEKPPAASSANMPTVAPTSNLFKYLQPDGPAKRQVAPSTQTSAPQTSAIRPPIPQDTRGF
jgi:hypothetical protein